MRCEQPRIKQNLVAVVAAMKVKGRETLAQKYPDRLKATAVCPFRGTEARFTALQNSIRLSKRSPLSNQGSFDLSVNRLLRLMFGITWKSWTNVLWTSNRTSKVTKCLLMRNRVHLPTDCVFPWPYAA